MARVAVIGAGPSGMVAALQASKNHEVFLLETNDKVGKKILVTGNGKCNFWNKEINIKKYNCDNSDKLNKILENKEEVFNYLTNELGIFYKEKNGYYYPYSNQASSIREIFEKQLIKNKINIKYNFKVKSILKINNEYKISSELNEEITCDKIILATGSKAAPKTGSDGSGYTLLKQLGYDINNVNPSLVPLKINDFCTKDWAGVRTDVNIKLYKDNTYIAEESGEIQLTEYGISGIVTLNLSGKISRLLSKSSDVFLSIDFLPEIDDLYNFFNIRSHNLPNTTIEEFLESIFNYKLMFVLLKKANINKTTNWNNLTKEEKEILINTIKKFKIKVVDTENFEKCQVCTGGLSLNNITNNFNLLNNPSIYVIGEILDVDGICGGYNLAFAFISGYIAGRDI